MIEIKVAKVRDYDLEEDKDMILFERNGKRYEGAMFSEPIGHTRVCKTYETISIQESSNEIDTMKEVFKTYFNLADKYNIKYFKSTLTTMMHWGYVNGFTNELMSTWDKNFTNFVATEIGRLDQVKEVM